MKRSVRGGFTLVELLVTITIIGIMMAFATAGIMAASNMARVDRTKSLIAKMDAQLAIRWESYATRRLPISSFAGSTNRIELSGSAVQGMAPTRLFALRELMRLELPQCWGDITSNTAAAPGAAPQMVPAYLNSTPQLSLAYLRRYNDCKVNGAQATPSATYEGAECLYLIVTMGLESDSTTDMISTNRAFESDDTKWVENNADPNVGDKDGDGMLEFWDGWKNPITFIRWAPGFVSDRQPSTEMSISADPFDNGGVEAFRQSHSATASATPRGFALYPLIMSAGPDEAMDIAAGNVTSDPYLSPFDGEASDTDGDGDESGDNIHNHLIGTK